MKEITLGAESEYKVVLNLTDSAHVIKLARWLLENLPESL